MMRLHRPGLVLFLSLLAAAAIASPPAGTLSGVVVSAKSAPVSGARVFWQSADGASPPHVLRTDSDGAFHAGALREGLYDVRAESAGISSEWERNVIVRPGQNVHVTLRLNRSTPPASGPSQKPPATTP
jgi:hypothetical protein